MREPCSICGRPFYAKGLCQAHYERQRTGRDLSAPIRPRAANGTSSYERTMIMSVWEGECLVFVGARDRSGYGRIGTTGTTRSMLAHRAVMEHHHGPSKRLVLHSCDNPPCVRIEHLRYGSTTDNVRDAVERGRARATVVLDDEQVVAIRNDLRPQRVIAAEYGISQPHVSRIRRGTRRRDT